MKYRAKRREPTPASGVNTRPGSGIVQSYWGGPSMAYETLELQDPADDGGRLVLHFERPRGSFDLDPTASRADTSILVLSRLTGVSQDELRELSPRDQVAAAAVASRMIEQASEVRAAS